jgi:hypothetical protein
MSRRLSSLVRTVRVVFHVWKPMGFAFVGL